MRWGVLGTGRVSSRWAEAIKQSGQTLWGIASRDASRAKLWAKQHNAMSAATSYEELLQWDEIDAVIITTPPGTHLEWIEKAAAAKKHILCEKPMGASIEQIVAAFDTCQQAGVRLWHTTGWIHHPRSHQMRQRVLSNELGQLRQITAACSFSDILQREDDHRWSSELGGGCLLDLMWYPVSFTLWLAQRLPKKIICTGREHRGVWSHVHVVAEFADGLLASWDAGFDTASRKWIEVAGEQASVVCDDFTRPWDNDKARYWMHQRDGKASEHRCESVNQELRLVNAFARSTIEQSQAIVSLGLLTHDILTGIGMSLSGSGMVEFESTDESLAATALQSPAWETLAN